MNELAGLLRRTIATQGPISVAQFMAEALLHPEHGYYTTHQPFGRDGDFITAPEISQMFGELIGLWCATEWQAMNMPASVNVVELGPGRGTLMQDALRAARALPRFRESLTPWLVEASPRLREMQKLRLEGSGAQWLDDLSQLPDGPIILIANEFFDALPIHQYECIGAGWAERLVANGPDGSFAFVLRHQVLPIERFGAAPAGHIKEDSPAAQAIMAELAGRLARYSGSALIIDYGYAEPGFGDTVQALHRHAFAHALERPGEQDITAHVDFAALADAARQEGCDVYGPAPQGAFLDALGLAARATRLKAQASPAGQQSIDQAYDRLTNPAAMGTLFKAMAVRSKSMAAPPAGFAS